MSETFLFRPPQRRGLMFHIIVATTLVAASAFTLIYGAEQAGGYSILLMLLSLLLFAPVPLVIYRGYALMRAAYRLERDGLRLSWGLRVEDIPLSEVEWVRRSTDLASNLPLPRLGWPGAVTGTVQAADLGTVEYLASTADPLVLIATPSKVYAISPEDPAGFLRAFERSLELGSLAPFDSYSARPAAYLAHVLNDRMARTLLGTGLGLLLLLVVLVGFIIPSRLASAPDTGAQFLLLPILGGFIFLADLATGLFFYRSDERRMIAYLLWISGVATLLLLLVAALVMM